MKKIISLFQRNYDGDRLVRDEVTPGAEWVLAGEGVPTVKIDGTCCLVRDGRLYKRYDAKKGRVPPEGWEPCQESPDEHTGHWPGWLPVGDGPEDRWHREAWEDTLNDTAMLAHSHFGEATYELIGPKIQGNPYNAEGHFFVKHGKRFWENEPPRDFDSLRTWFAEIKVEGIVWHHPDGRMVKIKRRDFGLPWPVETLKHEY